MIILHYFSVLYAWRLEQLCEPFHVAIKSSAGGVSSKQYRMLCHRDACRLSVSYAEKKSWNWGRVKKFEIRVKRLSKNPYVIFWLLVAFRQLKFIKVLKNRQLTQEVLSTKDIYAYQIIFMSIKEVNPFCCIF